MVALLEVKNLFINYQNLNLVRKISFQLESGKVLGIVGESGSGKSLIANSILRLNKESKFNYQGEINFSGKNILKYSEAELYDMRGKDISIIFRTLF